jgi:hypothetical protein
MKVSSLAKLLCVVSIYLIVCRPVLVQYEASGKLQYGVVTKSSNYGLSTTNSVDIYPESIKDAFEPSTNEVLVVANQRADETYTKHVGTLKGFDIRDSTATLVLSDGSRIKVDDSATIHCVTLWAFLRREWSSCMCLN